MNSMRYIHSPLPLPHQPLPFLTHWSPPWHAPFKINFNGALFKDISTIGLGVAIQDCRGEVIGAMSERIVLPFSVEEVEALACSKALLLAREIGITEADVEGDSAVVINFLNLGSSCLAGCGHVIEDLKAVEKAFSFISFSHVRCTGNLVAQRLARKDKSLLEPHFWLENVLEDISPCVTRDKALIQ